jgi:WD40 repeat protein
MGETLRDVWVWQLQERRARRLKVKPALSSAEILAACCVGDDLWIISHDGQLIRIPLHNPHTWVRYEWPSHLDLPGLNSSLDPDTAGQFLAVTTSNGAVIIDKHSPESPWVIRGEEAWGGADDVVWYPNGLTVAVAYDNNVVAFWDVHTRACLGWFDDHPGRVRALTFSRDGRFLVTGGEDGLICVWDFHEIVKQRLRSMPAT